MLEIILIIGVLFIILTFFYKQAICEFRINQIEWTQKDNVSSLLNEKVPLVVVPSTYSHMTEKELSFLGAKIVIYANHLLRSAYPAMRRVAEIILKNERAKEAEEHCMPIKEILDLIPGTK